MRPGQGRTYSDVTLPLRKLTAKSVRFEWTKQCEAAFLELKDLLMSGQVMAHYDPKKKTQQEQERQERQGQLSPRERKRIKGSGENTGRRVNRTRRGLM